MAGTVQLHRVIAAPPERVFRAYTDPDAMAKWLPPNGFVAKMHSMDFKEGGGYRMSFKNLTTNHIETFGGKFIEIRPNEMIKYTDKFENPNLPGEMHVSVSFRKVTGGTELKITHEGIPDAIPVDMCYMGWQQSLNQLTQLAEPEIKDQ